MTLVCITNDMRDVRPCVVKGVHTDMCDGLERRWAVVDARTGRETPGMSLLDPDRTMRRVLVDSTADDAVVLRTAAASAGKPRMVRPCGGCLPRQAEHGMLCWSCWSKTRDAFNLAVDMITHLASIDRAQQLDNAGIRGGTTWALPVPATWRLADEMLMLLGHPEPGLPSDATVWEVEAIVERFFEVINLEMWVARPAGAESAVKFYLAMQQAMKQHPMEEYEHRVQNVRCPKCVRRSLLWKPPLAHQSDDAENGRVRVVCTTPGCGHEMDEGSYERVAQIEDYWSKRKPAPVTPDEYRSEAVVLQKQWRRMSTPLDSLLERRIAYSYDPDESELRVEISRLAGHLTDGTPDRVLVDGFWATVEAVSQDRIRRERWYVTVRPFYPDDADPITVTLNEEPVLTSECQETEHDICPAEITGEPCDCTCHDEHNHETFLENVAEGVAVDEHSGIEA